MRRFKYSIGIVFAVMVLMGLYAFASKRNEKRGFQQSNVHFVEQKNRFISKVTVNKLLKQNQAVTSDEEKETLALKEVEQEIQSLKHVKGVNVYHSVNHQVDVVVEEHEPVARLFSSKPKYLSDTGDLMPLSERVAVRVPMIYGFNKDSKDDLLQLLNIIKEDDFLTQNVVGITCLKGNDFSLDLRSVKPNVVFGGLEDIEIKVENLKVFFVKAQKEGLLNQYKQFDLKVKNQVICTRK